MGCKGSWDDYGDWVSDCYLDETLAYEKLRDKNTQLIDLQKDPKFDIFRDENYEDNIGIEYHTQLELEWLEISSITRYRIEEHVIQDYLYVQRKETIEKLL